MINLKSVEHKSLNFVSARILSNVFNPLTLPLFIFGVAGWVTGYSINNIIQVIGISTLIFFVIPALSALAITKFGSGKGFDFHSRSTRPGLYLTSILSLGLGGFIIFNEI